MPGGCGWDGAVLRGESRDPSVGSAPQQGWTARRAGAGHQVTACPDAPGNNRD